MKSESKTVESQRSPLAAGSGMRNEGGGLPTLADADDGLFVAVPAPAPTTSAPIEPARSPSRRPKAPALRSNLDEISPGIVTGWAADYDRLDQRIEIEVLVDGNLVARGVADIFRVDLPSAGAGDGKHAFSIDLPLHLIDGRAHVVDVRDASTGESLANSPRTIEARVTAAYDVRLDGGALAGWARLPGLYGGVLAIQALEGTRTVAIGSAIPAEGDLDRFDFRLNLPNDLFDGQAHALSVVAKDPSVLLAQVALIVPGSLTPTDALQKYARDGLAFSLSAVPALRYNTLATCIASLHRNAPSKELAAELAQTIHCHATLVRGPSDTDRDFAPLKFPKWPSPRASIVIPVHNKFSVTYHCLASLLLARDRATFEVILVDDGSSDASTRIPELISGVTYVRNETAQGFVLACNRGGALVRGEYIVMLNNDTEVTAGWLEELLWPFEHFSGVGMTGAKLLYPDGRLQEAGGVVWNNGEPWNYGRNANAHDPRYNYSRQADYISGACIVLPTALWKSLGGFDEIFVPAYFEDTDLAFRVRAKGLKTVYAPMSQVIHYEGVSSGTSTASGMKRFQEVNRPKFRERWASSCRHHGKVGVDLELNKDRNVQLRALVLDMEVPQPDKNAGSYAAVQELQMLQALGFKCTFVPINMAWLAHYTENLQRMGVECIHAPFASSMASVIEQRGKEFDLIYITRYNVAERCLDAIAEHAPQAKVVLNNADLHFLRELRAGLAAGSRETIERALETRDRELSVMRAVDLVLSYTDVEKAVILSHNLDATAIARCPWVADVTAHVPSYETRVDIAFLGSYNHHPNAEAVEWFAQNVMPRLRDVLPEVRLRVYGSNVPASLARLADKDDRIVIEGWVPSVDVVYDRCRVLVAPLRSGAGIKGKVIGALAHGLPCVLSPIAAEGIPIGDGVEAFIADAPQAWVDAIVRLYADAATWTAMSRHAQTCARRHFGFEQGVQQMQEALRQAEIFTTTDNPTLASR